MNIQDSNKDNDDKMELIEKLSHLKKEPQDLKYPCIFIYISNSFLLFFISPEQNRKNREGQR